MNPPVVDRYLEELLSDIPLMGASQPAAAATAGAQPAAAAVAQVLNNFQPAAQPVERIAAAPAANAMPLAGPRRSATPGRWLRVCIGDDRYAVELLRVQEVVRVAPVVAMRGADSAVLGVMNLRGRIVPVFDLGVWLGAEAVMVEERSRVVVVERDDELIGLLVTAVCDVATLDGTNIEPPLTAGDPGAIVGVARVGDAPTVLLDANTLFE